MTTKELMNRTELDTLATKLVGDGKSPNLFFVSALAEGSTNEEESIVLTVTNEIGVAYNHWRKLASSCPSRMPMLEDRQYGVMASVDRNEDTGQLEVNEDSGQF